MASSSSSSNHINSSTGGDLREISIQLRAVQVIQEEHRPPQIYAVRFCDIDIDSNTYTSYFASVGGNCASVYEAGTTDSGRVQLVQGFLDEDVEEVLYTCCWTSAADGNPMLIVAGLRGILKCINCATFVIDATLFGHGNAINDLRRHVTDDALIFSASKDESIRLWNIRSAVCVAVFAGEKGHRDEVLSLDVHLLGHCFVSTGMDTM